MGNPVQGEAAGRNGPKEFNSSALTNIHEQMENGGGGNSEEDVKRRGWYLGWSASAQEKRESDEQAEQ